MSVGRFLLYFSTTAAFVIALRSWLIAPPPLVWALVAFAAYIGLILSGVFFIRLRMYVDAIVQGPADARGVVLTFDDGPDPEFTPIVLDKLERANATATFFIIAAKAERDPELVREILRRGHTIGLHSYEHDRLFALRSSERVRADLERGLRAIEDITGERPRWFRPPIGHTNPIISRVAEELDLAVIGWSVSGRDGIQANPEDVAARVRPGLRNGAIVLLHDAAERGDHVPAGPAALDIIFAALHAERLPIVPLAVWVNDYASGNTK